MIYYNGHLQQGDERGVKPSHLTPFASHRVTSTYFQQMPYPKPIPEFITERQRFSARILWDLRVPEAPFQGAKGYHATVALLGVQTRFTR